MKTPLPQNQENKKNKGKFVSKLRRWQTKHLGSRALRAALLTEHPYIEVKGVPVK